jgi:alpha-L-fucosidase 2
MELRVKGGRVVVKDGKLSVEGADEALLLVVAVTSFVNYQDISGDPAARCDGMLAKLASRDFATLLAVHQADYRTLYRRVAIELPRTDRADLPTNERINQIKKEGLDGDPSLAALHFNYGRYLLIASSRPGTQPANLQGVWNEELNPPWESKFTTNINFEMNYWPAELTALSECAEPMFDLIDDVRASGTRTAKAQYGARGWVLHHNTDLWRGTAPVNNIDGVWTTGGAWLCHHLWERYLFTGDREFLARRAYPVMKDAALFFMDFLEIDPRSGRLVTVPSYSPEHGNLTVGATMDHQLIRALFDYTIEAADVLGTDAEFVAELTSVRARLAPNFIGRHGQLQEWMDDVDEPNNRHRHLSPLVAVYPGWGVTPDDPKLWDAAKILLGWRGDGDTGWSFAWRMPLWARVGDGDVALRQLQGLLTRRTLPNLFDLCGPFQIDGNFGACAGVAEMLVQSHRRADLAGGERRHVIELLPALPKAWPAGAVSGLRARGGFEVSMKWANGKLTNVELESKNGNPCVLRVGDRSVELVTTAGGSYRFDGELVADGIF